MPVTSINNVIAAYNATAKAARGEATDDSSGSDSSIASTGPDFASLVSSGLKSAVAAGQKSEAMSEQAIAGKADIREVAAAVNNAEMTLQTVLAVRDKVISAYNQIMQMPI